MLKTVENIGFGITMMVERIRELFGEEVRKPYQKWRAAKYAHDFKNTVPNKLRT